MHSVHTHMRIGSAPGDVREDTSGERKRTNTRLVIELLEAIVTQMVVNWALSWDHQQTDVRRRKHAGTACVQCVPLECKFYIQKA